MKSEMDIPYETTPEQQLFFCLLAAHKWVTEVEPGQVAPGLRAWTCGTQACFGGHVASWSEFREIAAVGVGAEGSPVNPRLACSMFPDKWLFGDDSMFDPRGCHDADDLHPHASDYDIVVHRLDHRIRQLREILA